MPVMDVADWLAEAIDSVLGQSLPELELLIVDDGSSDGSWELACDAAARDGRVRVFRNPGRGGGAARNFGISIARGEYLAFADGDDLVPRRAYERMVGRARETGSEMVVGDYLSSGPGWTGRRNVGLPIYSDRASASLADEPRFLRDRVCWNRIIRRESWQALGLAFSNVARSNDILVMTRAYCAMEFDVISDVVYVYRRRVGSGSMTASRFRPEALEAHFGEELACLADITRLNDEDVRATYLQGVLEHDAWAHGRVLLTPEARATERYASARSTFLQLVAAAPNRTIEGLPDLQRLAYHWVAAGMHDEAAVLALIDEPERLRSALLEVGAPRFVDAVHHSPFPSNAVLARVLRAAYLSPLEPGRIHELPDDVVIEFAVAARAMQVAGVPRARLSARELAIIDRSAEPDVAAIRAGDYEAVDVTPPTARPSGVAGGTRRFAEVGRRLRSGAVARAGRLTSRSMERAGTLFGTRDEQGSERP